MNQSVIDNLFFGRSAAFGRRVAPSPEQIRINQKIEEEQRYFISKMSLDDCQRFEALTILYSQASLYDERDSFGYGLRLGITLLCELFYSEESSPAESK